MDDADGTGPEDAEARRRALYAKRDLLRARQAERMETLRRDTLRSDFARWHGAYLAEAGIAHDLLWDWDDRPTGPIAHYPFAFSGIDWRHVPDSVSTYGGIRSWQRELLAEALDALGIAPTQRVFVAWSSACMPRLVLSAGDVAQHAEELMRWCSDMWVFEPGAPWIIEVYHEGSVSYAHRPPSGTPVGPAS